MTFDGSCDRGGDRGTLVVVVDFQNDFILADGALPVFKQKEGSSPSSPSSLEIMDKENFPPSALARSDALIRRFNTYLSELDPQTTTAVLFTFDAHDEKTYAQTREAKLFPPHCIRGTKGYELALDATLIPAGIDTYKLEKGVFDMWEEPTSVVPFDPKNPELKRSRGATSLEEFLLSRNQEQRVEIIGVASDFCLKAAIVGFVRLGYPTLVWEDLSYGIDNPIREVLSTHSLLSPFLHCFYDDTPHRYHQRQDELQRQYREQLYSKQHQQTTKETAQQRLNLQLQIQHNNRSKRNTVNDIQLLTYTHDLGYQSTAHQPTIR